MPEIDFTPFEPDILEEQSSGSVDRAIWCCIAPYLLRPKSKRMREKIRTHYLAQLVLDLHNPKKKLAALDRRIKQLAFDVHTDTIGWIQALIDTPATTDIKEYEWAQDDEKTTKDYLTTHQNRRALFATGAQPGQRYLVQYTERDIHVSRRSIARLSFR